LVEESGLPPVRLHDLRHGAATLMLLAGDELKTIADQLGHSSVVRTADTYLSVAVELGLKSAVKAARLVLNAGKRPPGGGDVRRRGTPYSSKSPPDSSDTPERADNSAWPHPARTTRRPGQR
jgi:Phage integrase family